jgi:hypothetical protein
MEPVPAVDVARARHDMTTSVQFLCSLPISSRLDSSLKEKI